MSGWDWLHAGLQIATYTQARKAQQNVNSLQTAAEREVAGRALIEAMRNFVFDISRNIQRAEEHINEFPMQVYIVASSSEARFKDSGLSPAVFPEFSDKEYVDNTQRKISSVIETSRLKLTKEQIKQSKLAVKYLIEMPLLHEAIKAQSSFEQLEETDDEWDEAEDIKNNLKTKRSFGILGLVASPCLCFFMSASPGSQSSWGILLASLALIGAVVLLIGSNTNNHRYAELKAQREIFDKNLLPAETWHQVVETFGGDLPSEQYQKLLDDRITFLNQILGNEFQKFLTES